MVRIVLIAVALSLTSGVGRAQTPNTSPSPLRAEVEPRPARSFDLSSTRTNQTWKDDPAGRVVVGTELLANGTAGFGMFGEETARPSGSRVTARDYTLPGSRKPAVGFSLKF